MQKCVFGQKRPAKARMSVHAQSAQGLRCPLIESLDTSECLNQVSSKGPDDILNMHRVI